MKRFLMTLCVLALLLMAAGCQKNDSDSEAASGGDLPEIVTDAASSGTLPTEPASSGTLPEQADAVDASELSGWLWRTEGDIVRELRLRDDGTFTYRLGESNSEFTQWAKGNWALIGNELSFQASQTDESWNALEGTQPFSTAYAVVLAQDALGLTRSEGPGLDMLEEGETLVFIRNAG